MDIIQSAVNSAIEAIQRWTGEDPHAASQVAQKLAALNWDQIFTDQQQSKIDSQMEAMEVFLEWREKGGGFCDYCRENIYVGGYRHGPMYTAVYAWPHNFPYAIGISLEFISSQRFCIKCFQDMQDRAENMLYLKYRSEHPDMSNGKILTWYHKMFKCNECDRLIPRKSCYRIGGVYSHLGPYCLHCVEKGVEQQFSLCGLCSKKIANMRGNFCIDCQPISQLLGAQISSHNARARKAKRPATLTLAEWFTTVEYFGGKCAYCCTQPFQELEHFVPISKGGGTTVDNCVPACASCNSRKGSSSPEHLRRIFLPQHIDHIKHYLESSKNPVINPFIPQTRALVLI